MFAAEVHGKKTHLATLKDSTYMSGTLRVVAVLSGILLSLAVANSAIAGDGKPISVVGDDERDAYVGSGGLLLPGSFTGTVERKKMTAECLGCVWKYRLQCAGDLHDMCMQAALSCPSGTIRYEVWLTVPNENSQQMGTVCWGKSTPLTRERISREINQSSVHYVPALKPHATPPRQTLQGVANYFWSGQPIQFRSANTVISGVLVRVQAYPTWHWDWGDGTSQWTRLPGQRSTHSPLVHVFGRSGTYRVSVRTLWRAEYVVAGYGTFAVAGPPVTQQAALTLVVKRQHVALSAT